MISDSHGRNDHVEGVLKQVGHIDMLIHCGDVTSGDLYIQSLVTCPVHMVAGNLDQGLSLPKEKLIELEGHRILMAHGHGYYVNFGTRDLEADALANGCDITMYGHTHRPVIDESNPELLVLNPGSLAYPRQEGRRKSYMIVQLEEGKKPDVELKFL